MSHSTLKTLLTSAVSGMILTIAAQGSAQAGAFALREQSTVGLGMAFAGVAAGSANLGSMFWNPATMTKVPGWQSEWSASGIIPYSSLTGDGTSSSAYRGVKTGDFGSDAVIASGYSSYQVNDRVWVGLATNTPFGLATKPDRNSPMRPYNNSTKIISFDINPNVAFKVNDWLSLGVGAQIMYFKAKYTSAFPFPGRPIENSPVLGLEGDSWGVGYTLGATITPVVGTEIGIGFRSAVKQELKGDFTGGAPIAALNPAAVFGDGAFKATAVLPEVLTVGLKQRVNDRLSVSAGVEWTNWSRLRFPRVYSERTGSLNVLQPDLPLDYKDGWFFSVGAEYQINPAWTVRAGLGYEVSPVQDISRSLRLPDNDRIWTSIGASYNYNDKLTLDVSYAHLFPKSTSVRIDPNNPNYKAQYAALPGAAYATLSGKVDSHVDIVSVGLRYRWDDVSKTIPVEKAIVRKY